MFDGFFGSSYALEKQVQQNVEFACQLTQWVMEPFSRLPGPRSVGAWAQAAASATSVRDKPKFGLTQTMIEKQMVSVTEETLFEKPFCKIVSFKCADVQDRPTVLLCAPHSGHYATFVRGVARGLLPYFDVCITDWTNARDVPLSMGSFDYYKYMAYGDEFIERLKPDAAVFVCQPGPPMMATLAVRAEEKKENPAAAVLISCPINPAINETEITRFVRQHDLKWLKDNTINRVSAPYPGQGRLVRSGFRQLRDFSLKHWDSHLEKHMKQAGNIFRGDKAAIEAHDQFFDEYNAVMDMPAEYYLGTLKHVFQECALPAGTMEYKGKLVNLESIKDVHILAAEGAKDDIVRFGQCSCILDLSKGLPDSMKAHIVVPKADHYDMISGKHLDDTVMPSIVHFIYKALGDRRISYVPR